MRAEPVPDMVSSLTTPKTCQTCRACYSIVKISVNPVISKTSFTTSPTWISFILPFLFITFCNFKSTRRPADEMYSRSAKSSTSSCVSASSFSAKTSIQELWLCPVFLTALQYLLFLHFSFQSSGSYSSPFKSDYFRDFSLMSINYSDKTFFVRFSPYFMGLLYKESIFCVKFYQGFLSRQ